MIYPLQQIVGLLDKMLVIVELELRKIRHDPTELLTRAIQTALWLLVFGKVLGKTRAIPTGGLPYLDFMAPGILAQSVLSIAIFHGIAIIWELDLGLLHKLLASPIPRPALVLGVKINWHPQALAVVLLIAVLGASCFATLSLIIACVVKTRERFMGTGQVLTMPLFFSSNAIYPISLMPGWLKVISHLNPLTYELDALRALMLIGGTSVFGLGLDMGLLFMVTALLVIIGGRMYLRISI